MCVQGAGGPGRRNLIFEYLNLLVSRPDVAQALGARAKDYVARECNWARWRGATRLFWRRWWKAGVYREASRRWRTPRRPISAPICPLPARMGGLHARPRVSGNAPRRASSKPRDHAPRRRYRTGIPSEMGGTSDHARRSIASWVYGEVRECYYGEPGRVDHRCSNFRRGRAFECDVDHFRRREAHLSVSRRAFFSTVLLRD